jgi:MinD superfamily P-loop ATPase
MRELVIISGKGGTGKTSLVASFAALAENKVLADCDVDAADLHLILSPSVRKQEAFRAMPKFVVNQEACIRCGKCVPLCRFDAFKSTHSNDGKIERIEIDPISCEGCGVCAHFCPAEAIERATNESGHWFISDTRHGPMVHAKLGIAEENSGKLVTIVRNQARQVAKDKGLGLILVDGPPGIGCPVIASITGSDLVLIVTEPTLSARHDLERAAGLTRHFGIQTAVCINKCDLNREIAEEIRTWCNRQEIPVVGEVRYDPAFTEAQLREQSVVEYSNGVTAKAVEQVWQQLCETVKMEQH